MITIQMQQRFACSPEKTFAVMTDHVAFGKALNASVTLERVGVPAPNGLGAVRAVTARGLTVREEVVRWEAPRTMHYRVIGGAPLKDHLGEVNVVPDGAGSRVDYQIRFTLPWYLGGDLAAGLVGRMLQGEIQAGLGRIAAAVG